MVSQIRKAGNRSRSSRDRSAGQETGRVAEPLWSRLRGMVKVEKDIVRVKGRQRRRRAGRVSRTDADSHRAGVMNRAEVWNGRRKRDGRLTLIGECWSHVKGDVDVSLILRAFFQ